MPLFRSANKVLYYAHVPKAAGTTVEQYIKARFGHLAFHDATFGAQAPTERWSQTSPQHIPEAARQRYLPDSFLDASFATVRHPATRLFSAFLFQRDIEAAIPAGTPFKTWLDTLEKQTPNTPHLFDGHIRPMSDFIPEKAQVFQIEKGLNAVVDWLDLQTGSTAPDIVMAPKNVLVDRLRFQKREVPTDTITPDAFERIAVMYRTDYARFGYDLYPPGAG